MSPGLAMASALYGTVLGSLLGSWPTDRFGRKLTLTWIGVLYVISAVGCGYSWNVQSFIAARFIGGIGIGISTVAAPLYISEIAPPAYRGRLGGMFQFNIVFGIIIAFLSNFLLKDLGANAWRWMRRCVKPLPISASGARLQNRVARHGASSCIAATCVRKCGFERLATPFASS